jgi:molybdate transport system regulatory protein
MRLGPLKIKLQFLCGDAFALGPGKADLLEAIVRTGSISAAGRETGMSYRRTWLLVDELNRCFNDKIVETLAGGGRERGARVTESGLQLLKNYRTLEMEAAYLAESKAYRNLLKALLDVPRPSKTQS